MSEANHSQEPRLGLGHYSAVVNGKIWTWGGQTKSSPQPPSDVVQIFDPDQEKWEFVPTDGKQPSTLYYGACTSVENSMCIYGGQEADSAEVYTNSLYKLDLDASKNQVTWTLLNDEGPMKNAGCRMVNYKNRLILFGGYGEQPTSSKSKEYFDSTSYKSRRGCGWMNLLCIYEYDLDKGNVYCIMYGGPTWCHGMLVR
jgi:N-acetylneuraminic acid mutarotase